MNFVEKFDGFLPSMDAHARGQVHVDNVSAHAPPGAIVVDDAHLLFTGDFKRSGLDLVLSKDDRELVLHDYFKGEKRAALASPDGAHLTGDIVSALTGYTQYAQAGGAPDAAKIIGHVTKLAGNATAIRNGVAIVLNQGDNVYKGDVVQSGSDSTLGITFIDGTVFGLGSNAKMVLNEMIYDPNGSNNSSLMSLVQGTISFVAGQTAKHGDMKVDTPVATMGIRGTAVLVEIDFEVPGQGGAPPAKFQVLVEPDGTTGSYILFDKTTLNPIATVNQAGTQTIVNGQGTVSFLSSAQLSTDAQKIINDVFALKFTDNTNPNTKLTTNFTDTVVPITFGFKLPNGDIVTPTLFVLNLVDKLAAATGGFKGNDHIPGPPTVTTENGAFVERAGVTHDASADTISGKIKWLDVNLGDIPTGSASFTSFTYKDAHNSDKTSSLTPEQLAAIKAVEVPLVVEQDPGNRNVGSATWTYSLPDGAFDFLAAGETLTLTYTARVDNNFELSNETGFQTFTITITGTNDLPVITSSPQTAAITEIPGAKNSEVPDTAIGAITFTDPDLTDTHSVAIIGVTESGVTTGLADKAKVLSWLSLGKLTDSTDGVTGSRSWTFSAADKNFDYLAAGETLTLTYTVQVDDHHGGVVTQPVMITITGTNDTPVITSSAQTAAITELPDATGSSTPDKASGVVTFTDVDLSDTHSVTVTGVTEAGVTTGLADQQTVLNWLSLGTLTDSTHGVTGSRAWTFSAADKSFDYLAAGETLTLTYAVQVNDHHGGVVTQPVTITITGTNDVPVITSAPQAVAITEAPDTTGSVKPDAASGAVTFTDVDLSDTHSVTITGVTETGVTTGLADDATVLSWLTLGTLADSTNGATGSQSWAFSAPDKNFDYLAAGQTLTLIYSIQVDDHHGGLISEPVTITITGSNDTPAITSSAQTGAITEVPDTTGSVKPDTATGAVTFTDVDLADTHSVTVAGVTESGVTSGLSDEATVLSWLTLGMLTDSTNGATGSQPWTFSALDKNFDYLAADQTLMLTYTIQVDDHHGGVVTQPVTITITGTNDAPTLASVNAGTLTDTAAYDSFSNLSGQLVGSDKDVGETATLKYAALNASHHAVTTPVTGHYGSLTVHDDGSYTYVPNAVAINALSDGTYHDTFDVQTTDAHGAVGTATLTVDVIGANDAPVIHTDNLTVSGNPDGTTKIAGLSVTDADAGVNEGFVLSATSVGPGSSVLPASVSAGLSNINTSLTSGLTYDKGTSPPATDMVTVKVSDSHQASDTVNLIFNLAQNPTQPVTLTGTSDKDVFFATGFQDKFVFAPNFNHDAIIGFQSGQDQIDLSAVVSTSDLATWFSTHVAPSPTNSADTLITIDSADTIAVRNATLTKNDFIVHIT
ncbi:VCBS domain-containing protein [Bradyrhizobium erythrophlei]|uniref:VCBS domain-containing protein n=1 Tax=Bradyrhizobium erythrophlei TaxID=1437360 RepID=UPI0035EC5F7F